MNKRNVNCARRADLNFMKTNNNRIPSSLPRRRSPSRFENFRREVISLPDLPISIKMPRPDASNRMLYLGLIIVFGTVIFLAVMANA